MLLALLLTTEPTIADMDRILDAYNRKGALVLRRCRMILKDEAAAEDALQDVFIRLMRYSGKVTAGEIPLSWLYRTAERCCFDRMRKLGREVEVDPEILAETVAAASGGEGDGPVETGEIVMRFLHTLNDKLKQVALLYYVDGLSQERIAAEVGWSRRTVGKKLKQLARHAAFLKKELDRK